MLLNAGVTLCYPLTRPSLSLSLSLFTGRSADHIVCCLSRDSYGTGVFLQELMSALSLQQQLPLPEPSDQDFYSQFTNTNTGNRAATQRTSLFICNSSFWAGHMAYTQKSQMSVTGMFYSEGDCRNNVFTVLGPTVYKTTLIISKTSSSLLFLEKDFFKSKKNIKFNIFNIVHI